MTATDRAKFATYCALTCLGGSENKGCACRCPDDCALQSHPYFAAARDEARARMLRVFRNMITATTKGA